MSVADKLASVLTRFGRPMTLRRNTLGPIVAGNATVFPLDVTIYGVARNYKANELVSGTAIVQGDTEVTFSNAQIAAAQWPGPPKAGDVIIFDNRNAVVQGKPEPKSLGTELLVYVAQVRG